MLTIEITNDGTGTNATGNYDYRALVGGRVIAEGRVERHSRASGWPELVRRVAEDGERGRMLATYEDLMKLMQERDSATPLVVQPAEEGS